ncbi:hypothetical protein INR49_000864 [Caranx melampygus]|nr:hypothetical protein INR49_000864 [Caranx melampygus]
MSPSPAIAAAAVVSHSPPRGGASVCLRTSSPLLRPDLTMQTESMADLSAPPPLPTNKQTNKQTNKPHPKPPPPLPFPLVMSQDDKKKKKNMLDNFL